MSFIWFFFIFQGLVDNLLTSCDGNLKLKLVDLAAEYEHRLNLGQKPIFHLEAFIIAFMAIYKRFVEDALGSTMEWWNMIILWQLLADL